MPAPEVYPEPIAFNVIGAAGNFADGDDHTDEERKMMFETRKILEDESIGVAVTCVRVPVRVCHSEAVNIQTREPLSAEEARELLAAAPGADRRGRPDAAAGRRAATRCSSGGSAATSPTRARSACGSSATTCARAPPPTRSRSPSCWSSGGCSPDGTPSRRRPHRRSADSPNVCQHADLDLGSNFRIG